MQKDTSWIKGLKPGDKVFLHTNYFSTGIITPDVVERVTKSMIILRKSITRFRLNGEEVGRSMHSAAHYLYPDTAALQEEYWIQENRKVLVRLVAKLGVIPIERIHLTREQIERITPILTAVCDELNPPKVQ